MKIVNQSTTNDFDVSTLLANNIENINKAKVNITSSFIDKEGNETIKKDIINMYRLYNFSQIPSELSFKYSFENLSNVELEILVEIYEENGTNIKYSESVYYNRVNIIDDIIEINDVLFNSKENYYYRFIVSCKDEDWTETYDGILLTGIDDYIYILDESVLGGFSNVNLDFNVGEITDPEYIKKLLIFYTNPKEEYEYIIDRDMESIIPLNNYTNYANRNDVYIGKPYEFGLYNNIDRLNIENISYIVHKNGKKLNPNEYTIEQGYDGLDKLYINRNKLERNDRLSITGIKADVFLNENHICKLTISDKDEINKLHTNGLVIKSHKIGSLSNGQDLFVYIRRKGETLSTRINPKRYHCIVEYNGKNRYGVRIYLQDNSVIIGDELFVVEGRIVDENIFKVDSLNNPNDFNIVPCFYLPLSQITKNTGEFENKIDYLLENLSIFVNGYRLYNELDYILLQPSIHLELPIMILFKDIIPFGSTIECVNTASLENSFYFINEVQSYSNLDTAFIVLPENSYPLIETCFEVFCNNKKVPEKDYTIINKRILCFNKLTSKKNVCIKFYYRKSKYICNGNENFTDVLLNMYNKYPNEADAKLNTMTPQQIINEYVNKPGFIVDIKETDKDIYNGLKYINQLDKQFDFLYDFYNELKENRIIDFDCNNMNRFSSSDKNIPINGRKLPALFNHDININFNNNLSGEVFKDNISIINTGRMYQIYDYFDSCRENIGVNDDIILDCNDLNTFEYDVNLNENIRHNLPYINNDINIDCNKNIKDVK